jgi:hypothetical protein
MRATCHTHLVLFDLITLTIFGNKIRAMKFIMRQFPPRSVIHNTLPSKTLSLCSSPKMSRGKRKEDLSQESQ